MDVAVSRSEGLAHEALIYSTDEELLSALVPFVREGITLGKPVVVVLPDPKASLLREALEEDARLVSFVDATALYRSPAHAIAEYRRRMTGLLSGSDTLLRVVGEVQFETSGREHDAWMRYESAIHAVTASWPSRSSASTTRESIRMTSSPMLRAHTLASGRVAARARAKPMRLRSR